MGYLSKVGPLQTDEGKADIYFLVRDDGSVQPVEALDDAGAIQRGRVLTRGRLRCDPALGAAAREVGAQVLPLPPHIADLRAALAFELAAGPLAPQLQPALFLELLSAAERFEAAEPWRAFAQDVPFELKIQGGLNHTFEAAVMGHDGDVHGLALYFRPGSVRDLVRFAAESSLEDAASLECLSFTLDRQPSFLVEAISAVSELTRAPALLHLRRGEEARVSPDEVRAVIAAMHAVSDAALGGPGRGECRSGRKTTASLPHVAERRENVPAADPYQGVERNDPCPCGSGRKFKKCHASTGIAAPPALPESHHQRDRRLVERILEFGGATFGHARIREHLAAPFAGRAQDPQLAVPLACYETPLDGRTLAEHFLARNGPSLSPEDRDWISRALAGRLAIWEVLRVDHGAGVEVIDLLGSGRCFVTDVAGSTQLRPRHAVLGRVVGADEQVSLFCGIHGVPLPPRWSRGAVEAVRSSALGPGGKLLGPAALTAWDDKVGELALAAASPTRVTNTDGEPFRLLTQELKLARGSREQVIARLLGLEGAQLEEDLRTRSTISFVRPGNAVHAEWKNTLIASARIAGARLELTANSTERMDRLLALVRQRLGPLASVGARHETPMPDGRGLGEVMLDAQSVTPAEAARLTQDSTQSWLDQPLPALDGLTPRKAASTDAGRRELHWVLKDLEQATGAGGSPYDVPLLRKTLGLTETGEPLPHHALHLAVGAGRKISETLLDFAAPVLDAASAKDEAAMRETLSFAIGVWNAAIEEELRPTAVGEARRQLARAPGAAQALERFELLLRRKREQFAEDRRQVGGFEVRRTGGTLSFFMSAFVSNELLRRLDEAGIRPTESGGDAA